MNISLTPEMDDWIAQKLGSGMYKSSSEIIREGLRLLKLREEQRTGMVENLRNELLIGIKQLDAGKASGFDQDIADKVKHNARKMLAL
ncbi:MAG: type II toxin-antitoxin system ParD family antitoxin [Pseudomonadota bacterium]|nr:type II toxin-antitoxin system ParD family antitoxin [Pseudomonadota bacterium]